MMVARHEMPVNRPARIQSRLVLPSQDGDGGRVRYDRSTGLISRPIDMLGTSNHTVPCGTARVCRFPRHFMPGYHHFVPPRP
jgi:hypothetical protein